MSKHHSEPQSRTEPPEHPHEPDMGLERLVFFSDAVMAIAMTLLALEIKLPGAEAELTSAQLLSQLTAIWPKYLGFVLSFLVVGLYWMSHNRQFRNLRRYDSTLVRLNFVFLLLIAFLPFPTSVASEHSNSAATILYAAVVALTGLTMLLMFLYTRRRPNLLRQPLTPTQFRNNLYRQSIPPLVFLISIGVAVWNSDLARYFWIITALSFFIRVEEVPLQR